MRLCNDARRIREEALGAAYGLADMHGSVESGGEAPKAKPNASAFTLEAPLTYVE